MHTEKPLAYKPDFPEAARRMRAFWRGEILDRVPIMVTAPIEPSPDAPELPGPPRSLEEQWLDMPRRAQECEALVARKYWGGEAIPFGFVNLGPYLLTALMGGRMILHERTIWTHHWVEDPEQVLGMQPDYKCVWWTRLQEMMGELSERAKGKFLLSLTDMHGPADHLAGILGGEQLATCLMDSPDLAHACLEHILKLYLDFHERHWSQLCAVQSGTVTWQGWWTPGKAEILQEDFIDLLSPDQYREFVQPIDQVICDRMEQTLYHIHGTMIRHWEPICELAGLRAMQWPSWNLRGQGYMPIGPELDVWLPYLKKIQAAGKAVYLGIAADEVERVIAELDPRHLILQVASCASRDEADALLDQAVSWTQQRLSELGPQLAGAL
jgi:hypothetical protein